MAKALRTGKRIEETGNLRIIRRLYYAKVECSPRVRRHGKIAVMTHLRWRVPHLKSNQEQHQQDHQPNGAQQMPILRAELHAIAP